MVLFGELMSGRALTSRYEAESETEDEVLAAADDEDVVGDVELEEISRSLDCRSASRDAAASPHRRSRSRPSLMM